MSRRDQIRMSDEEIAAFLDEQRTVILASNGRDGWPHLMPLWYVVRDGELWSWTFARSQKTRNIERDPRVALQIEAGESYGQLRGLMIRANVTVHRDVEVVTDVATDLFGRYTADGGTPAPEVLEMIHGQAPKRVALQFVAAAPAVSWDHAKLGGAY
ncbi:MAG: pyridoxamine 5-phosphate oxidase-related FMN-binding protein [Conexibacter sp.]|jgi:PPOX class probable F420-dependent enzyme|nr:pyridoxamine 5-phosphate oxidase-related FMN-binding protein [Conexibacter sp.]